MSGSVGAFVVGGGLCLLPEQGLVAADLVCADGCIAEIRRPGSTTRPDIDAADCLVLPGIVDIHGDAFERQVMPRPKALFPLEMALHDTDRQLVANGITTAYHGITLSWEPGLRSMEQSLAVIAALERLEPHFAADHRIHIRWETFALEAMGEVRSLLACRKKPLLAFNDHTSPLMSVADVRGAVNRHAGRSMVAPERYLVLYEAAATHRDAVPAAVRSLAAAARLHGVPMLSHDDRSIADRAFYRELGVRIAEFPVTAEVLEATAAAGDVVVLGGPNVVRGGSHNGAVPAEDAIRRGQCSILASDYYYPAPLHAALGLVNRGVLPFEHAWDLVSAAPAAAAGLLDRGRIAEGLRADLVVLGGRERRTVATLCAGRAIYRTR